MPVRMTIFACPTCATVYNSPADCVRHELEAHGTRYGSDMGLSSRETSVENEGRETGGRETEGRETEGKERDARETEDEMENRQSEVNVEVDDYVDEYQSDGDSSTAVDEAPTPLKQHPSVVVAPETPQRQQRNSHSPPPLIRPPAPQLSPILAEPTYVYLEEEMRQPQAGQLKPQGEQQKPQGEQQKPQGEQQKPQGEQLKPQAKQRKTPTKKPAGKVKLKAKKQPKVQQIEPTSELESKGKLTPPRSTKRSSDIMSTIINRSYDGADDEEAGVFDQSPTTGPPPKIPRRPNVVKDGPQSATKAKLKCRSCEEMFHKYTQRTRHEKKSHPDSAIKPYGCAMCKKRYVSEDSVYAHVKKIHGSG